MKILTIPFISKPKAKTLTKWVAKYIINNSWEVIDEWCELLEWTQIRWKNSYWNKFNKKIIQFRKDIMFDDSKTEILSKEKLNFINNYFYKNLNTILNHDIYITWSNPTGSNYNFKRTPYIIYWWKYNQYMFINFFKKLRKKWIKHIRNDNLEKITLEEYLNIFPKIKQDFDNFNKILFIALQSDETNEETKSIDTSEISKEIIDLIISPNYKIELKNKEERNKLRVATLRRIFKNRLRNIKPSDHLFWELPEDMCEAAHIFPVSEIKKMDLNNWYMIADENNWINIPTQFHKLYDKNIIYFNEYNWKVNFTNEQYRKSLTEFFGNKNFKIINNLLNKKRKEYIKMYNNYFVKK